MFADLLAEPQSHYYEIDSRVANQRLLLSSVKVVLLVSFIV